MREINVKYELMRATADHLATEVERLRSERDAYNERCDELRRDAVAKDAEIAALTKALDEALSVRIKLEGGSSQIVINMVDGTWNFWNRHNSKNFELSPASRALCERLFGGKS